MPRKRNQEVLELDKRKQEALKAWKAGEYKSGLQASIAFGVPKTSLYQLGQGGKTRAQAREDQQILTIPEEKTLERWLLHLTETGYPARHPMVIKLAEEIRKLRLVGINYDTSQLVTYPPIGQSWSQRFIRRHPNLETRILKQIEASRIKDVTKERIDMYFDELEEAIKKHGIEWENVYNFDETGFQIGTMESGHVIIDKNARIKYQRQPGRQEWVTCIECICADGTALDPLIIFKGDGNVNVQWIPKRVRDKWYFAVNTKGWTSNIHGSEWMIQVFDMQTREKANGRKRLLICDGHDSHITAPVIAHVIKNDIILAILPPHSSHLTQPLDVGVFGPLKKAMSATLDQLIRTGIHRLEKIEWLDCYSNARSKAFTQSNILAGFRGTGIHPQSRLKIYRKLPDAPSTSEPPPETSPTKATLYKVSADSTPNSSHLHAANQLFLEALARGVVTSPIKAYARTLASFSEQARAKNAILLDAYNEAKKANEARKERAKGKRLIIKDKTIVSSVEIHEALAELALEKEKKVKPTGRKRGRPQKNPIVEAPKTTSEDELDELESEEYDHE